jgi:hypothetical protein
MRQETAISLIIVFAQYKSAFVSFRVLFIFFYEAFLPLLFYPSSIDIHFFIDIVLMFEELEDEGTKSIPSM